jgi:hypothetical protein
MRPDLPPYLTSPTSYLSGALEYKTAVDLISAAPPSSMPIEPLGFLAAHCAELVLKALLLQSGVSASDLRREIGHDLNRLWQIALERGVPLEEPVPFWCEVLALAHDKPYTFRYPREHWGVAIPEPDQLRSGLDRLLEAARRYIQEPSPRS